MKIVKEMGIVLAILCVAMLAGCSSAAYKELKESDPEKKLGSYGEFKIVDSVKISTMYSENYSYIVQDVTTGCMYVADKIDSNSLTISPLYDEFGEVKGCGNH